MKNVYLKFFNIVLNTGIVPESWTYRIINPIFKNKGDPNSPENYRPITLLSCMGKLFTSIINTRLQMFVENNDIINDFQTGFRSGFSTVDNMFILQTLIQILHNKKKKLFCAFIDLKRAFDTVWRIGLWSKLIKYDVNGKCLKLIKNMYGNIKSAVTVNGTSSNSFPCNIGVRQGENLSPLMFSIYLNDLHDFISNSGIVNGVNINQSELDDTALTFLKLFIILYADDTVIMSESENDLQNALNKYQEYCDIWKLTVNTSKSNILIFSKGRLNNYQFTYQGKTLEIVNEYKYLGVLFSKSGSFYNAKKYIAKQGTRALYSFLKKVKCLSLPIDMQIKIFNKTVKPVLLYGC